MSPSRVQIAGEVQEVVVRRELGEEGEGPRCDHFHGGAGPREQLRFQDAAGLLNITGALIGLDEKKRFQPLLIMMRPNVERNHVVNFGQGRVFMGSMKKAQLHSK